MPLRSLALLCVGLMILAVSVRAHHAPNIYDTETEKLITGTVELFDWVQPHTWVTLSVLDTEGVARTWMFEGGNPLYLGRIGWTRYSLQPGDEITVAYYPRRDSSRKGMFLRLIYPDGSIKVMSVN